jgi:hypothetical protein
MLFVALVVDTSSAFSAEEQDILRIDGLHAGEMLDVVVMIDARQQKGVNASVCRDGSKKDPEGQWVVRHTGASPLVIPLGNLLTPGACNSEIVVFSEKHKMHIERVRWTNQPGDVHTVKLEPRIKVPINLWTVSDRHEKQARSDLALVQKLYNENRVGMEFVAEFRTLSKELASRILKEKCAAVASVRKQAQAYIPGQLNVYYIEGYIGSDGLPGGRNCAIEKTPENIVNCLASEFALHPKHDANFTIVSTGSSTPPFTLAHELGHAFGLRPSECHGHVNNQRLPSGKLAFHFENIMFGGPFCAQQRKFFTLAQVFRMNTQLDRWGGTMLIENGLRPVKDGRKCLPKLWTDQCPLLNTHWFPIPVREECRN